MGPHEKAENRPYFALAITKIRFYIGLALLVTGLAVSGLMDNSNILGILADCGTVYVIASLVVGWSYVKCSYCGESLMLSGRIPSILPDYCLHCGEKL